MTAVRSVQFGPWRGQSEQATHIGTGFNEVFRPPGRRTGWDLMAQFLWDTALPIKDVTDEYETLTFTFGLNPGETVPANFAGIGWVEGFVVPPIISNRELVGQLFLRWKTRPNYTTATVPP